MKTKCTIIFTILLNLIAGTASAQKHHIVRRASSTGSQTKTPQKKDGTTAQYSTKAISDLTITVRGVNFVMKGVQGGTFTMGRTRDQGTEAIDVWNEGTHRVALSSFRIGQTEVTQQLWEAVMSSNPSWYKGGNLPVEDMTVDDIKTFIQKLNSLTGRHFRLPTEAEWEYAARGGSKSRGYKYSGSNNVSEVAWHYQSGEELTSHPVATKKPNELGLYDMSGNVTEVVADKGGMYPKTMQINPKGPSSGDYMIERGGAVGHSSLDVLRVSVRSFFSYKGAHSSGRGFRLAL